MTNLPKQLPSLDRHYDTYCQKCLEQKVTPLHFNAWVTARLNGLEDQLAELKQRLDQNEGGK